jgi:Fur family ferric uptake transcriptional regulator
MTDEKGSGTTGVSEHEDFSVQRALEALRGRGLRATAMKRAVLEAFENGDCALTAEEIGARIGIDTDLSPLYRCLASLEEAGILVHFYLEGGSRRYDLADEFGSHHHHLVCEKCSEVTRLDGCGLGDHVAAAATSQGYVVHHHDLILKGVCPDCRTGPGGKDAV